MQKHNEHVFANTLGPTFISKMMDINHQSCLPSYKLSNDPSKHLQFKFKKYVGWIMMLVIMQPMMVLWNGTNKHQQHIVTKPSNG